VDGSAAFYFIGVTVARGTYDFSVRDIVFGQTTLA